MCPQLGFLAEFEMYFKLVFNLQWVFLPCLIQYCTLGFLIKFNCILYWLIINIVKLNFFFMKNNTIYTSLINTTM